MPTIISANLKRLQKLKELTIVQLAEKSGVSVRTIERIRSGKHVPDLETIKKLAKALGQKPEHLVEGAIKKARKQTPLEKGFICYGSPYTPEDRKDFTKFERELSYTQAAKEWNQKINDCLDAMELREIKFKQIKRQIITTAFLAAITLFIAFYFAL
jgi:transcriptional regulator with XRE-family HTH domain